MTSLISNTASTEPPAGLAAVVGGAASTGNERLAGGAVSAFGALMGSMGQALADDSQAQLQGELEPHARDDSSDDAERPNEEQALAQAPAGDALLQAMWPRAQGFDGRTGNVSVETPQAKSIQQPQQDVTLPQEAEGAVDGAALEMAAGQKQTAAAPAGPGRTGTQEAVGPAAALADEAVVHSRDAGDAAMVRKGSGPNSRSGLQEAEPGDGLQAPTGDDLMAWQRAAYAHAVNMPPPRANAPTGQDDAAQDVPSWLNDAAPLQAQGPRMYFGPPPAATGPQADAAAFVAVPRDGTEEPLPTEGQTVALERGSAAPNDGSAQASADDDADTLAGRATAAAAAMAQFSFFPASMMPAPNAPVQPQAAAPSEPDATAQEPRSERIGARGLERPRGAAEDAAPEAPESASAASGAEAFQRTLHAALQPATAGVGTPQEVQAATAQASPPIQSVAVSHELAQAISQGAGRVQMRVLPEGLGELDIKVQMTGQQVHLTIRGDAPELAHLLSQKVHELRQDLSQQGLSLEAMDFGSLTSGNGSMGAGQDDRGRSFTQRDSDVLADSSGNGLQRLAGGRADRDAAPISRSARSGSTSRTIDVIL